MKEKAEIRKIVICELKGQGKSYEEIANILKISRQRVFQIYTGYRTTPIRDRRIAMKLAQDRCVICESKEDIEIHHLDNDTNNNEQYNLMVLCRSCHNKLSKKIK